MLRYAANIEPDGAGFMVSFRDIPEALTGDETYEGAKTMAAAGLLTAMHFYFEDRRPVPLPSPVQPGEVLIALPASASAKVLLLNGMLAQGVKASELARRLDTRRQEMNRIIDLRHTTKIDTLAQAFAALGKSLEVTLA